MTNDKIFISHASKDINYVKSFMENILILGLEIDPNRIFCSSMEGYGIKSGQYIPDRLKEEINKSSLALLMVSRNYKSSEICLNEVGAAWVTLKKEAIIPMLLPNIDFSELGFLDLNRLGLKITEREGILKFIQDCKEQLNLRFNLEKIHKKIEAYLKEIENIEKSTISNVFSELEEEYDEWKECFNKNLFPFDEIIRKAIPAHDDGIHRITDTKKINQILTDLSKAEFLNDFWFKFSEGDYYVEQLKKLTSGNWLISKFNWEAKISDMWVCMDTEMQYEFILIKTERLDPFEIDSDIGGFSYNIGILKDGTKVSNNEQLNGYAIIKGETINLLEHGVESRYRNDDSHWVFLVSDYHKAGFNANETIAFCEKLDSGKIEVSHENIYKFLRGLRNNPIVIKYR